MVFIYVLVPRVLMLGQWESGFILQESIFLCMLVDVWSENESSKYILRSV